MAVINGTNGNDTLIGRFDLPVLFFDFPDTINGLDGNDSLTGLGTDDTLNGGTGDDTLRGQGGNDSLNGGIGADILDGGIGADILDGGDNDDLYIVDNVRDVATEVMGDSRAGVDTVQSSVTYTLSANLENLTFLTGTAPINGTGNAQDNVINGNQGTNVLLGLAGNDILNGGGFGDDILKGGFGNDTLNGGFGNDILKGEFGDDILSGGFGTNTLNGGFGNDTLKGGFGNNSLNGGSGNDLYIIPIGSLLSSLDIVGELADEGIDTVESSASQTLGANQENLVLTGSNTIFGIGNNLSNVITGNNASNILLGSGGNDTIQGLGGNDVLTGDAGNDILVGGEGNDRLNGTNFTLEGNGERDSLRSDSVLDTDIFILGQRSGTIEKVYYNNLGNTDYAVISDFDFNTRDPFRFSDQIELLGSAANYSLSNVTVDGISGTGISFGGDLISIVQNVNASDLSLTSANQFIYV
ncbi:hypothetical protein LC607_04170 [Nostoc sp. CHAB 5824]|nr:hypothetical protein [Nostoc sp. CHAB 5824]